MSMCWCISGFFKFDFECNSLLVTIVADKTTLLYHGTTEKLFFNFQNMDKI